MKLTNHELRFTEEKLEQAIIALLEKEGIPYAPGSTIVRQPDEVLIRDDLKTFLLQEYKDQQLTPTEADQIILDLEKFPASDLYESNKAIMKMISDGFILKREDRSKKDLYISLIDYSGLWRFKALDQDEEDDEDFVQLAAQDIDTDYHKDNNIYKIVNQLEITGFEKRIPDTILYINGLPLVVFEFKSAIRENATIFNAYEQLTVRYRRDIPELFKYNAFCVISDGVNNKAGSFFAPYEFFYAWRKTEGMPDEVDGIDSLYTMVQGMFHKKRLRDIIRNFIFFPDASRKNEKIVCRYPQYYAAVKLYESIMQHQRPHGDGKGGTYFGATGCGKSYTMLFLTRLLMKSLRFASPTIVLITDRTDLDDQLSAQFTGTPIDATLDVFGDIVDSYTMTESVKDEITVRIVYEGRAAKILLNNSELQKIEDYYNQCAEEGANEHQIEESKRAMASMNVILGDPDRLRSLAEDFVQHYETRVAEGSTVRGKAMIVCSSRLIAWELYKNIIALRPQWAEVKVCDEGVQLTEKEQQEIMPMERIKMVMTRGNDDPDDLYNLLGTKEYRKELDRQFKNGKSNFKIAIVVDMWLTGFDVPFLDTMYIDKPIQRHSLIQTISRVNRKFENKEKGLVVDYIGIKKQMNLALAHYNRVDSQNFEDIDMSVTVVKDHLDLLTKIFHNFNTSGYYHGAPLEQLHTLNMAAEFVQVTETLEKRFMQLVKRMKAAYDICSGSEKISQTERDRIHFFLAVRSIVFKLTKGTAPDIAQMNARVRQLIQDALSSEGVEEIFKLTDDKNAEVDIFNDDYLAKIEKIKLPNTKIKLLQKLLARAIEEFKRVNKIKGIDFSQKLQSLVERYNDRKEADVLRSEVLDEFTDEIIDLYHALKRERASFLDMGIDFEEKAFYDILKALAVKYDFVYPEEKLIPLAQKVKEVVDDKARYTDWSRRDDIKAELKADLIILLAENDYPPVDRDEVYKEIFEQAENFKKYGRG